MKYADEKATVTHFIGV